MKKLFKILVLLVLFTLVLFIAYTAYPSTVGNVIKFNKKENPVSSKTQTSSLKVHDPYVLPDFDKFRQMIKKEPMIHDIPSSGSINIYFYHFVQGNRKIDKVYLVTKGNIEEKAIDSDINLYLSSDYINKIGASDFCSIVKEARSNGDLGYDLNIGKARLLIKYKNMLKYKSCFGL
jgi:hypothetical protein